MTYLKIKWSHSNPNSPIVIFSELDDLRWEVRKVEIFADGRKGYADVDQEVGGTGLGEYPIPPISEFADDVDLEPLEITKEEFEREWSAREVREGFND